MKFGICATVNPSVVSLLKKTGFDYVEGTVAAILKPAESQSAFEDKWAEIIEMAVPVEAVNCFLPGTLKITGEHPDVATASRYATTAIARAGQAGIPIIVFGSGDARAVPEGFDHVVAIRQIKDFIRHIAPAALENHVTIAIEPLRRQECNILCTVNEVSDMVRCIQHPAVRLLVDAFHWNANGESAQDIIANGDLLCHTHIATFPNRVAPGLEPFDFSLFFSAIKTAHYDARLSIEATMPETLEVFERAHQTLSTL